MELIISNASANGWLARILGCYDGIIHLHPY
jgi:hypothetical protein